MSGHCQIVLTVQQEQLNRVRTLFHRRVDEAIGSTNETHHLICLRWPHVNDLSLYEGAQLQDAGIAHDIVVRDRTERTVNTLYVRFDPTGQIWISLPTPLHLIPLADPNRSPCKHPVLFPTSWVHQIANGKTYRLIQILESNA